MRPGTGPQGCRNRSGCAIAYPRVCIHWPRNYQVRQRYRRTPVGTAWCGPLSARLFSFPLPTSIDRGRGTVPARHDRIRQDNRMCRPMVPSPSNFIYVRFQDYCCRWEIAELYKCVHCFGILPRHWKRLFVDGNRIGEVLLNIRTRLDALSPGETVINVPVEREGCQAFFGGDRVISESRGPLWLWRSAFRIAGSRSGPGARSRIRAMTTLVRSARRSR